MDLFDDEINLLIKDGLERLEGTNTDTPGYFPLQAIENIPYIEYPGFSKDENLFAMQVAQDVLTISKNKNNYKEVAITYRLDVPITERKYDKDNFDNESENRSYNKDNCTIVKGTSCFVPYLHDKDTANLLKMSGNLMVVSLHNHPDDSDFSFNDVGIFCMKDQIKLMCIVTTKGEVSFLERTNNNSLFPLFISSVNTVAPDLIQRSQFCPGKKELETLTHREKEQIRLLILSQMKYYGVYYNKKISKETDLSFELPINNFTNRLEVYKEIKEKLSELHELKQQDNEYNPNNDSLIDTIENNIRDLMSDNDISEKNIHDMFIIEDADELITIISSNSIEKEDDWNLGL